MKLIDTERVDGTGITIGRRVQFRKTPDGSVNDGTRREHVSRTYTAVYKDVDGRWRQDGLGTTNRREARRLALAIQHRLEAGQERPKAGTMPLATLIDLYMQEARHKGLTPKSVAKYKADFAKLRVFVQAYRIDTIAQVTPAVFYRFRQHLITATHKQGLTYAPKSVEATLVLTKQLIKWAWKHGHISTYALANVTMPTASARPQACFTTAQVEALLVHVDEPDRSALAILAYTGMRIGELTQLRWEDVLLDKGELGMLHIRRGGSADTTKDKDARFVPIHPRIRPLLATLPRSGPLVLPKVRERTLLARLKRACRKAGLSNPDQYKLHSFRHHFASMCANHHVASRKALAWMGHSSSEILDLYYKLHDDESEASMKALAATSPAITRDGR